MSYISSSISTETELVMHFSVYKITTLDLNGMLYVLNHYFYLFAFRNVTKLYRSIDFGLVTLIQQLFTLVVIRNKQ